MIQIRLKATPNRVVKMRITGAILFRFNDRGEYVFFKDTYGAKTIARLKATFEYEEEEVKILTLIEYDRLKEYKDKYNKKKMEVVTLKGQLKRDKNEIKNEKKEKNNI